MVQGLIFLGLVFLVLGPLHWYLWRRLVKDTTRPGLARKIGTGVFLALVASLIAAFVVPRVVGPSAGSAIALIGYLWLAIMFYLLVIMAVLEIPRLIALRLARPTPAQALAPTQAEPTPDTPDDPADTPDDPAPARVANPAAEPDQQVAAPADTGDGNRATAGDRVMGGDEERERAELSRRLLITRSIAIFAGLTATGIVAGGVRTALGDPVLKRVQIPLAKLPRALDGYKIALVSDIHLGPLTGIEHTQRIVRSINGMQADLVAVVGDMVDGSVAELGAEAQPLRGLLSRDGAYFVTGNHEYYSGAQEWIEEVTRLGMRPLRNERVTIRGLDVAGVNDIAGSDFPEAGGGPDFRAALGDRDPSAPVVLLAHQPVQAVEAAKYKVDLQLSGHTHGGQMVPFNYVARLQQPVISGVGDVDGTKVYVTNGAGFWGPPVRVGAPPDITLVELKAG